MTSTVTTATIESSGMAQVTGALGLVIILGLMAFLVAKEVVVGAPAPPATSWSLALRVGIVPLVLAAVMIVAVNVALVLS